MNLDGHSHCFRSSHLSCPGIRNPWTRSGRLRWHLSIPQRRSWTCVRRPSTSVPRKVTFPVCSCNQERHHSCATCKCQTQARLGKKESYQLPSKSEQRNYMYFRSTERTTFISLHELCTQCFARFSVSPTFLRANF